MDIWQRKSRGIIPALPEAQRFLEERIQKEKRLEKRRTLASSIVVGMDEIVQEFERVVKGSSSGIINNYSQSTRSFVHKAPTYFRFADFASAFNWGALALVLGSYGLLLSNPVFWICWSILVIKAVIYNSIQGGFKDQIGGFTTMPHTAAAIIFKLGMSIALITLLLSTHDITKRQNIMMLIIAISVILFEGVTPILRGIEGLSNPRGNITASQKLETLIFLISSALNAMITMTGPIILGGDLGRLMCKQAFWGFTFIFLVDVLAEVFLQIVNEGRSPFVMSEDLPKTHHVVVILRMIVEGCLCWWMGRMIYQHSYFPSNLVSDKLYDDCNKLCQERSKHLLTTMVALGGLQATTTFIGFSLCFVLAHRQCPMIPSFFHPHSHIASH